MTNKNDLRVFPTLKNTNSEQMEKLKVPLLYTMTSSPSSKKLDANVVGPTPPEPAM